MLRRQTSDVSPRQLTSPTRALSGSPFNRLYTTPSIDSQSIPSFSEGSLSFDSNLPSEARAARRTPQSYSKESPSNQCFWLFLALAMLALFCGSVTVMVQNQYGHIHDHIDRDYNLYVAVWQAGELEEFYNTNWMLIVDDVHTMDMGRTAETTKSTKVVLGTKLRRNLTSHVEFSASGIIPFVFFSNSPQDMAESNNPARWQRVIPEMMVHQNFRLRGIHEASGYTSWITLDDYPFVRRAPDVQGLSAKQCEERQGSYENGVCQFMEYLTEVCIRAAVDPESYNRHNYDIDYSHAGAGCYPEDGLRIPQYTKLPHLAGDRPGEFFLPVAARNATRMTLRHAHDPELMEKVLKYEMFQELSVKKQRFIIGACVAVLSLLLLVPAWLRSSPAAMRSARKAYLRWRYKSHGGKCDDHPYRTNSAMSV